MGDEPVSSSPALEEDRMVGIAIAMFIALVGWGARYFGWDDPDGKVQLALATTFILGIISGYKTKSDAEATRTLARLASMSAAP